MKNRIMVLLGTALFTIGAAYVIFRRRAGSRLPNQGVYRLYAPIYDRLFGPLYAAERRHTADLLELKHGERLLISGVGTGLDLPLIRPGVEVVGIDISPEMLQQAALKTTQADVQLVQMDAQCLDLPAESFDAVLLNLIVSVAPDGQAVFREAWRVLKPSGLLVLLDKFASYGHSIGAIRKGLGSFFRLLGTDVNRRLSDVVGNLEDGVEEVNHSSIFFGLYRILRYSKVKN